MALAACSPPAATEYTDVIRHAGVKTFFLDDDALLDLGHAACDKLAGGQDPVEIRRYVLQQHVGISVPQGSAIVIAASRELCQDHELDADALDWAT